MKLLANDRQNDVNGSFLQTIYLKGYVFKHFFEGVYFCRILKVFHHSYWRNILFLKSNTLPPLSLAKAAHKPIPIHASIQPSIHAHHMGFHRYNWWNACMRGSASLAGEKHVEEGCLLARVFNFSENKWRKIWTLEGLGTGILRFFFQGFSFQIAALIFFLT